MAQPLQQRHHLIGPLCFRVLQRRQPEPARLLRVDVLRLVQEQVHLLHHVRLAVQPRQVVARRLFLVRRRRQVVPKLARGAASHEEHAPRERVGGPSLGQNADDVEVAPNCCGVEGGVPIGRHTGIRAGLEQSVDHFGVTAVGCNERRRATRAGLVDVGAVLKKELEAVCEVLK